MFINGPILLEKFFQKGGVWKKKKNKKNKGVRSLAVYEGGWVVYRIVVQTFILYIMVYFSFNFAWYYIFHPPQICRLSLSF